MLLHFLYTVKKKVKFIIAKIKMQFNKLNAKDKNLKVVVILSLNELGPSVSVAKQAYTQNLYVHIFSPSFPYLEGKFAHNWSKIDPRTDFVKALNITRKLKPIAILLEEKNLLLPMQCFLADKLNLKSVGRKAAETSNSKIALRECLDESNIPSVLWKKLDEDKGFEFDFPCIIKPDQGTSSKGVMLIQKCEDILSFKKSDHYKRALKDLSIKKPFLIEKFIKGRQFDVEGIALNKKYYFISIVEEFYENCPPFFPPKWFHFNPPINDDLKKVIFENSKKSLRALGVINGAFHLEQRIDEKGIVRSLDYANRMGYNSLVSLASGINVTENYVKMMTGISNNIGEIKHKSVLQLYALDYETLSNMKNFYNNHANHVFSKQFSKFDFAFQLYLGRMTIVFENYAKLNEKLKKYNLLPKEFNKFYYNKN